MSTVVPNTQYYVLLAYYTRPTTSVTAKVPGCTAQQKGTLEVQQQERRHQDTTQTHHMHIHMCCREKNLQCIATRVMKGCTNSPRMEGAQELHVHNQHDLAAANRNCLTRRRVVFKLSATCFNMCQASLSATCISHLKDSRLLHLPSSAASTAYRMN